MLENVEKSTPHSEAASAKPEQTPVQLAEPLWQQCLNCGVNYTPGPLPASFLPKRLVPVPPASSPSNALRVIFTDDCCFNCQSDMTTYTAISHVWGDAKHQPSKSPISGISWAVPVNSPDKISRILSATQSLTPPPHYLWMDILCIDQEDPDDKYAQVNVMSDIYSSSSMCLVILEDATEADIKAFNEATALFVSLRNKSHGGFRGLLSLTKLDGVAEAAGVLNKLVELAWFKRVWTWQECYLPRGNVMGISIEGSGEIIDLRATVRSAKNAAQVTDVYSPNPLRMFVKMEPDLEQKSVAEVLETISKRSCSVEEDRMYV